MKYTIEFELPDNDTVKEGIKTAFVTWNVWGYSGFTHAKPMPPTQPKRPKGEWIYGEHDIAMCDGYMCNQCGFFVPWDYKHKFIDFIKDYHWCPFCGADMRGEPNG